MSEIVALNGVPRSPTKLIELWGGIGLPPVHPVNGPLVPPPVSPPHPRLLPHPDCASTAAHSIASATIARLHFDTVADLMVQAVGAPRSGSFRDIRPHLRTAGTVWKSQSEPGWVP